MSVELDKLTVDHVASLAKLKISENDKDEYLQHLLKVLKHIEELEEVETSQTEPMLNPMRELKTYYSEAQNMRRDEVAPSLTVEEVLQNAPDKKLNQFKIEAIIEDE